MIRTIAAAAIAAILIQRVRRVADDHDIHPIAHSSRAQRTLEMAKLGARRSVDRTATGAMARFGSEERRRRLVAELELREARDVVDSLGKMKGALMKLGQMASYLDDGLPEPMRVALAELRSDAPPMSGELALTEIERSLGQPLLTLFDHLDPEPMAAASIGQVHRATTRDGRDVAVKVQYPGIAGAIAADLDNTETLANMLAFVFPGLDPASLVEELRDRILEELDYEQEARNQKAFADYYRGHPHIWVPDVIEELSTHQVLTTEFVPGRPFEKSFELDQAERDRYAEILYRFVFRSLNRQMAFNGDPHPGNYILADDGRLAFLDFGLVKYFDPADVDQFTALIQAMIHGDHHRFRQEAERVEVLRPGAPFTDDEVFDWFSAYYELILEDREITITPEYSGQLLRKTFDAKANAILKHTNVPPTFALIQRINLGLFSILAKMNATANWRRISEELWAWTDGPPSTPLGEDEAKWLATQPH